MFGFTRAGGTVCSNVQVHTPLHGERGVFISKPAWTESSSALAHIPASLVITADTAARSDIVDRCCKLLGEHVANDAVYLALFLLTEKAVGDASQWKWYLDALPHSPINALDFEESDMAALSGTPLGLAAEAKLKQLQRHYVGIAPALERWKEAHKLDSTVSFDMYKWAHAIVLSRSISLQSCENASSYGTCDRALLPFLDMFNHSAHPTAFWTVNDDKSITICAASTSDDPPTCSDDPQLVELCFYYGDKPNTEWVYEYGFLPNENAHDAWPLFVELQGSTDFKELKQLWLQELELLPRIMLPDPATAGAKQGLPFDSLLVLCLAVVDDTCEEFGCKVGRVELDPPYFSVNGRLIDDPEALIRVPGLASRALRGCASLLEKQSLAMHDASQLPGLKSVTVKRDTLMEIEKKWQKDWEERHVFEIDMPEDDSVTPEALHDKYPKWMGTFPFPYMNGVLHLGHAFSVSKIEFATGWERLKGKRALFPFGFHVTGMPIKAAADKIARELEMFGPEFVVPEDDGAALESKLEDMSVGDTPKAGGNFRGKKSKVEAKTGNKKYQFQIMQDQGMSNAEIAKFANAEHWLKHYPPIAINDLKAMGCKIDWRRSFLTTDYNPYYDSFARWQFTRLREMGKIKFGKRYTIWSAKDGQPCMDHDRQSGEGVGPQEYTCIKMQVLSWSADAEQIVAATPELAGKKVFLVAATLRPETMYGQTNCFIGTKLEYGFFQSAASDEVYVITERAARNMSFQSLSPVDGQTSKLASISGQAIVGTKVKAPLSCYSDGVYMLPMENVLATKGTGVVTSVPSDSPDDYAALRDLKKKVDFYGIKPEWVEGFEPVPVITTEAYGDMTAPALCQELKINSQKDRDQLAKAKEIAYKEGFYNGVMSVGEFKGQSVQEAKPKVRELLINSGEGFAYAEPENLVMSRSGDECVVSLCDQWYFDYGEASWKALAEECLAAMETFDDETRHQFQLKLDWLHQWACVRTYGLGSKVPWDPSYLIESLSDSTIYMSYYTVAHLLHRSLDGSSTGPLGIQPQDMDNAAWDYVLQGKELPVGHSKSQELAMLRRSFLYWYPVDIRSSGKDLIQNHLTFFIYIHTAMFPKQEWPRSVRINGHLMLNGEKMSKSTGNTLSLRESCDLYGADATRLSLADAGDSVEDANFEESTANAAILHLFTLMEWITEAQKALCQSETSPDSTVKVDDIKLRPASSPLTVVDQVFDAEMDALTLSTGAEYEKTMYRDALKSGFYEFIKGREWYVNVTADSGMHPTLLRKYINRQVIQLCPITPHWAEHIWKTVMGNADSIMDARWPTDLPAEPDYSLLAVGDYIRKTVRSARDAEAKLRSKKKKSKGGAASEVDLSKPRAIDIFVAYEFPEWQEEVIAALKANYNAESGKFDDKQVLSTLGASGMLKNKKVMPFAQEIKKRVVLTGTKAFDRAVAFKEVELLNELAAYLKRTLEFDAVNIIDLSSSKDLRDDQAKAAEVAVPGEPSFLIYNI
ncbi:cytosolic leucyl tRNA synthetase [Coemansia sp. RSA 989]|nr:cytosolic leucyl tRNA synthetase [Coemansia sp. RSA 1086]KAJ1750419.1 cytosolic leucyl tRNA synthetase [Coemansia sp. RSA 1821]KAJ1865121.1 cytosolic leucyl tRNA synthetase [Coemansia sp. RSA 989]KAJ1875003.1 cytosolic leucyl tRNA synthetase [Coemansia sp. RSA 990]KAJ2675435.1 cytosolic leucyl tRNA synthetase [Coemansia sp. RSA 1085]